MPLRWGLKQNKTLGGGGMAACGADRSSDNEQPSAANHFVSLYRTGWRFCLVFIEDRVTCPSNPGINYL